MASQRSVAGVVRRCRSGERSEGGADENGVRTDGRMISIITESLMAQEQMNIIRLPCYIYMSGRSAPTIPT